MPDSPVQNFQQYIKAKHAHDKEILHEIHMINTFEIAELQTKISVTLFGKQPKSCIPPRYSGRIPNNLTRT